jgi:hypothetical protein
MVPPDARRPVHTVGVCATWRSLPHLAPELRAQTAAVPSAAERSPALGPAHACDTARAGAPRQTAEVQTSRRLGTSRADATAPQRSAPVGGRHAGLGGSVRRERPGSPETAGVGDGACSVRGPYDP